MEMTTNDTEIQEITDFILESGEGLYADSDRDRIQHFVEKHLQFGTFLLVRDENGVVACVRWNWLDPKTIFVLDAVIRKDYRRRSGSLIRRIIALGIQKNPTIRFICFGRWHKYPERRPLIYSVIELLNLIGGRK